MKQKILPTIGLLLASSLLFLLHGQNYELKGIIKSRIDNQALIGATILEKGSSNGAVTDLEGRFSITLTANPATLVVNYVGMTSQELQVNPSTPFLEIVLSDEASSLNEVVVVGYGVQKKSDLTGAVSKASVDRATAVPTTNVLEMLRGQATGVQVTLASARPGGTSNVLIRGRKSIRGGNDPLVVLDGFPIESINDINPEDIASIEVLKDASAQAIYGARASNGVILVTTKKGKSGKLKVNLSSYVTTQDLSKNFELYNAEAFAQLRREARRAINPIVNGAQAYSPDTVNFGGTSKSPEYINFIKENYVNWEDAVLRTGRINNNTISVSGGTESTKIFTSATYFTQTGVVPSAAYKRGSFRINIDQKINDRASIEANINIASDQQRIETPSLDFITISPFTGPYDAAGNLVKNVAGANASSSTINPLWNIRESNNSVKTNFYNLNLVGNYRLAKNLTYKLNTLLSRRSVNNGAYISKLHSAGVTPNGSATLANTLREEYLIENILNYALELNAKNRIDFTAVQSVNQRNTAQTSTTGTGFGNDLLGYRGITNALIFKSSYAEEQYRLASFLGRMRFTLADKYLLTLTARRDGASVFAENNKWGFFPAVAAAWQIHRESFLENVNFLDQLKARASYGAVGNQSLNPYTTLGVVSNYPYIFGGAIVSGNLPGSVLPNPNLSWETSTTLNLGLDFGLFDQRISGTIEYYKTSTTNLLTDISLGGTSGFSSMITNGGKSENRGIELLLTGHILRSAKVNWSLSAAISRNTNKIIKTGISDDLGNPKDDLGRNRFVGQPINVIRTLVFDGIFQTAEEALASPQGTLGGMVTPFQNVATLTAGSIRIKDVNKDGVINDKDNVIIKTDPDWYASLYSCFRYGGLELLADLYIVEGATKFNPYLASFNEGGTLQSVRNGIKVNYWTPENPSNTHPRPNFNNAPANIGTMGIADASYVRLRTLSLGYSIPQTALSKLNMSSFKLYVTATNLITITDYKSYSPENNPNDFPDTRSFTAGVNVGF